MDILEFIKSSFLHVAPILAAGCIAAAIILERYRTLFLSYSIKNPALFLEKINALTLSGRIADAISLCDQFPGKPAASLVKNALERAHEPEEIIQSGIEMSLSDSTGKIQKRTSYLATIANVSTLLGLLGTIAGLIHSFEAVGHADAQQKAAMLASGISTAMNATMLGLGVAIPCMVAFSFLVNRSNSLVKELEHAALRTMDAIKRSCYHDVKDGASSEVKAS